MNRRFNALTIAGIPTMLAGLGILIPKLIVEKDIWWTPEDKAVGFEETRNHVRILVDGVPVEEMIDSKKIDFTDQEGKVQGLKRKHITMRVNNYQQQRARSYLAAVFLMFIFASGLTMLVAGLFIVPKMGKEEAVDRGGPAPPTPSGAPPPTVPEPGVKAAPESPAPPETPPAEPKRPTLTDTGIQRKRAAITERIVAAAEKDKGESKLPSLRSTLGAGQEKKAETPPAPKAPPQPPAKSAPQPPAKPPVAAPPPAPAAPKAPPSPPAKKEEKPSGDVHLADFLNEDDEDETAKT